MFHKLFVLILYSTISFPSFGDYVPDILTGEYGETILGKGHVVVMDISPDKKTLATGTNLGIFLWEINGEMNKPYKYIPIRDFINIKGRALKYFFETPYCMKFINNHTILAGVNYLTLYNVDGIKKSVMTLDSLPEQRWPDQSPLISRDGMWIFSSHYDGVQNFTLKKWNIQTGISTFQQNSSKSFSLIAGEYWRVTPNGKFLIYTDQDQSTEITIIDTETSNQQDLSTIFKFPGKPEMVNISDDSRQLYMITGSTSSNSDIFHYCRYSLEEKKVVFEKDISEIHTQSVDFHEKKGELFVFNKIVFNASDATVVSLLENSRTEFKEELRKNIIFEETIDGFSLWNALNGRKILDNHYFIDVTLGIYQWPSYPFRPFNFGYKYSNQKKQINIGQCFYNTGSDSVKKMELQGDFTLQYSKDGSKLYRAGYSDSTKSYQVYTCDSETGKTCSTIDIKEVPVLLLPNNQLLACEPIYQATGTRDFFIYNTDDGSLVKKLNLPIKSLENILLSPWGDEILFKGDKTIVVPFPELNPIMEILIPHSFLCITYGETRNEILTGGLYGIELYERNSGKSALVENNMLYPPYYSINKILSTPYLLASGYWDKPNQVLFKGYNDTFVGIPLSNRDVVGY